LLLLSLRLLLRCQSGQTLLLAGRHSIREGWEADLVRWRGKSLASRGRICVSVGEAHGGVHRTAHIVVGLSCGKCGWHWRCSTVRVGRVAPWGWPVAHRLLIWRHTTGGAPRTATVHARCEGAQTIAGQTDGRGEHVAGGGRGLGCAGCVCWLVFVNGEMVGRRELEGWQLVSSGPSSCEALGSGLHHGIWL
jgi:hypothetical protein